MGKRFEMAKSAIHNKWRRHDSFPSADTLQGGQREQSSNETGHKMVEETIGPVLSIMSEV